MRDLSREREGAGSARRDKQEEKCMWYAGGNIHGDAADKPMLLTSLDLLDWEAL